jgi:ArsR family transcriptional regulator
MENLSGSIELLDENSALHLAELFRALSDPTRVRMLWMMMDGEKNVTALAEGVQISEPGVSHHLRSLRLLRLVRTRKQGREVYYSLADEHVSQLIHYGMDHVILG